MKTVAQKVAAIQKSIDLQERTKRNIEASRVSLSEVDGMDCDRMLLMCDEIIQNLENRLHAIPRRSLQVA